MALAPRRLQTSSSRTARACAFTLSVARRVELDSTGCGTYCSIALGSFGNAHARKFFADFRSVPPCHNPTRSAKTKRAEKVLFTGNSTPIHRRPCSAARSTASRPGRQGIRSARNMLRNPGWPSNVVRHVPGAGAVDQHHRDACALRAGWNHSAQAAHRRLADWWDRRGIDTLVPPKAPGARYSSIWTTFSDADLPCANASGLAATVSRSAADSKKE